MKESHGAVGTEFYVQLWPFPLKRNNSFNKHGVVTGLPFLCARKSFVRIATSFKNGKMEQTRSYPQRIEIPIVTSNKTLWGVERSELHYVSFSATVVAHSVPDYLINWPVTAKRSV